MVIRLSRVALGAGQFRSRLRIVWLHHEDALKGQNRLFNMAPRRNLNIQTEPVNALFLDWVLGRFVGEHP